MSVIKSAVTRLFVMALFFGISNPVSATVLGFTDILESSEPGSVAIVASRYGIDDISRINDFAHDSSVKNTDVEWPVVCTNCQACWILQ
ncbi:MAG: hypothetical protein GY792_22880 [Gammaproteobacteria bacterium]|nr:hypothetical protein [Gammaproteobacteria bacterium]